MAKHVRRLVSSAVLIPLVVMAVLSGLLAWEVRLLLREATWVDHTDAVIAQSNRTLRLFLDMESSSRGFLLTRDKRFMDAYRSADAQALVTLGQLGALVADQPVQTARITELGDLFARWHALAETALDEPTSAAGVRSSALERNEHMDQI